MGSFVSVHARVVTLPVYVASVACSLHAMAHSAYASIVTPVSATRSVSNTVTIFGRFNQSFTDTEMGGGFPRAQMSVTMTQDSTIGDGTNSPFVSYFGSGSSSSTAGAITNAFATGNNHFNLVFDVNTPATMVHTFPLAPNAFECTLTPAGGSAINLLAMASQSLVVSPGRYTLAINRSVLVTNGNSSSSWSLTGTVSFVPAPSAALPLTLAFPFALIRRRPVPGN